MSMTTPREMEGCDVSCRLSAFYKAHVNLTLATSGSWREISDSDTRLLSLVNNCVMGTAVCLLGILANAVNLSVFIRQGFVDAINVTFTSLAIADLMALVMILWRNVLFLPQMRESSLPIDVAPFRYLTAGWTHTYFVRVSGWITALVTFERCLCIAMPIKVKTMLTPFKALCVQLTVYSVILASVAPIYYTSQFAWKFYPMENRSLLGVRYVENRMQIEKVVLPINGHFLPLAALTINVVCTAILVVKLNRHRRWRRDQASGKSNNAGSANVKENRIVRMAIALSTIYIACILPNWMNQAWMVADPEYRVDGRMRNVFFVCTSYVVLLRALNCSVNFFVYYHMSSKFRSTVREMFKLEIVLGKGKN